MIVEFTPDGQAAFDALPEERRKRVNEYLEMMFGVSQQEDVDADTIAQVVEWTDNHTHKWVEQPDEPPMDVCFGCGCTRE